MAVDRVLERRHIVIGRSDVEPGVGYDITAAPGAGVAVAVGVGVGVGVGVPLGVEVGVGVGVGVGEPPVLS